MSPHTAGASSEPCWCCASPTPAGTAVHLGVHPEVVVCLNCAHSLDKRAREIEDAGRTGAAVRARTVLRAGRAAVIRRGWHRNRYAGELLRRIGRFTP